VRLRVCARFGSSATACVGRQRGLCHCRLLGAVILLQEVPVQSLERAEGVEGQPWVPIGSLVGPRFWAGTRGSPQKIRQRWVPVALW
jgi:hypothetical protein